MDAVFRTAVSYATREFVRGFLIGQFVLLLLLLLLLRLLLFRTPRVPPASTRVSIALNEGRGSLKSLTEKESCEWLNDLLGAVAKRKLASIGQLKEHLCRSLQDMLPPMVGPLEVVNLAITQHPPRILWPQWMAAEEHLQVRLEWSQDDPLAVEVNTALQVYWPPTSTTGQTPLAELPCHIGISVERISATLVLLNRQEENGGLKEWYWACSILPEQFDLVLRIESSFGHHTRLRNVPKVRDLLVSRIEAALRETIVWPRYKRIKEL